jgi:SAM-dependent methyltransferase
VQRADRAQARKRFSAFSAIYRENKWRGTETKSGPGSGAEATAALAEWLPKVCADLGITSVLDAGCGEGTWQPHLPGYIGVDIVAEALTVARSRHPDRFYGLLDICSDVLPRADAVLCRDALQHLPLADAQAAIENFRRMGARYLIASSHQGEANKNVRPGAWYPCNLQAPPFDFGAPLTELFDGHWEGVDFWPTKVIGAWAL